MQASAVKNAEELPALTTPLLPHVLPPFAVHKRNPLGERSGEEFSKGVLPPGLPGLYRLTARRTSSPLLSKSRSKAKKGSATLEGRNRKCSYYKGFLRRKKRQKFLDFCNGVSEISMEKKIGVVRKVERGLAGSIVEDFTSWLLHLIRCA